MSRPKSAILVELVYRTSFYHKMQTNSLPCDVIIFFPGGESRALFFSLLLNVHNNSNGYCTYPSMNIHIRVWSQTEWPVVEWNADSIKMCMQWYLTKEATLMPSHIRKIIISHTRLFEGPKKSGRRLDWQSNNRTSQKKNQREHTESKPQHHDLLKSINGWIHFGQCNAGHGLGCPSD